MVGGEGYRKVKRSAWNVPWKSTRWWSVSNIFGIFTPKFGEEWSILTIIIFSYGLVSTTNQSSIGIPQKWRFKTGSFDLTINSTWVGWLQQNQMQFQGIHFRKFYWRNTMPKARIILHHFSGLNSLPSFRGVFSISSAFLLPEGSFFFDTWVFSCHSLAWACYEWTDAHMFFLRKKRSSKGSLQNIYVLEVFPSGLLSVCEPPGGPKFKSRKLPSQNLGTSDQPPQLRGCRNFWPFGQTSAVSLRNGRRKRASIWTQDPEMRNSMYVCNLCVYIYIIYF